MKILAIIPARCGSKRIPNKNFKPLGGRPLINYTKAVAEAAMMPGEKYPACIDRYVISTDNSEYRGPNVIIRPPELCRDDTPDWPVIQHTLVEVKDKFDLICYLRPTTPFRVMYHVEEAIKTMIAAGDNATGLRSVEPMGESAYKCFEKSKGYLFPLMTRSGLNMTDVPNQLCPPTYKPNGYIDICKPELIEKGELWGDKIIGYVTPRTIELDTPEDWEFAEFELQRGKIFNYWKDDIS